MAEREGFEPPCRLPGKTLSRRPRYDHFGTSPLIGARANPPEFIILLPRGLVRRLPSALEEGLDQLARFSREDASGDVDAVIQRRVLVGLHGRLDGASLRLGCAVDEPRDAGVHHRADAHLAGLDR